MWKTKTFKTRTEMDRWLAERDGKIQWNEIFINQASENDPGYAVEWRRLKKIVNPR